MKKKKCHLEKTKIKKNLRYIVCVCVSFVIKVCYSYLLVEFGRVLNWVHEVSLLMGSFFLDRSIDKMKRKFL